MRLGKVLGGVVLVMSLSGGTAGSENVKGWDSFALGYNTPVDSRLQDALVTVDKQIRELLGIAPDQAAAGLLDLRGQRLAMIHPDRIEYAASVPKIGILLAYFHLNPDAAENLDETTRHELGLMVKASSNEASTRFSRELGLKAIQTALNDHGFYDPDRGGGLWVGKHYGRGDERYGDPVGDHSHAATVRQLLRFFLLLEQEKLVSPAASRVMRRILESPEIPHDPIKFVKGLEGKELRVIRKWGSWQEWHHDAAVVTGPERHYILVALTKHPEGDTYLSELARRVDDLLRPQGGEAPRQATAKPRN